MVRFLVEKKALMLHIPRTGGTWFERALDKTEIRSSRWVKKQPEFYPKKHCLLSHMSRKDMAKVNFVFAFVRHPIAYYESVWKWMSRKNYSRLIRKRWRWHPHRTAVMQYRRASGFNDWVCRMLKNRPCWYTRLVEQYVGPEGGEFCDFIGRTETLIEDFMLLLNELGYNEQVPPENELRCMERHNSIDMRIVWDRKLQAQVLQQEVLVLNRFYEGTNLERRWYNNV